MNPLLLARTTVLLFLALAPAFAFAATPKTGDTRAAVDAALGNPTVVRTLPDGSITARYPRGTVEYDASGRAVKVAVLDDAAWQKILDQNKAETAARARRTAAIEAREQAARAEHAARLAADRAEFEKLIDTAEYKQLSPAGRIQKIDTFAKNHPGADTQLLRADLAQSVEKQEATDARIAKLEAALTSARAELARRDAEIAGLRGDVKSLRDNPPAAVTGGYLFGYYNGAPAYRPPIAIVPPAAAPGANPGGKPTVTPGKLVQPQPYNVGNTRFTPPPVFVPEKTADKDKDKKPAR